MNAPAKHCPLCGAQARLMHAQVKDYFFGSPGHWDLYQCTAADCGVAAPLPAPDDAALARAYGHYYTHGSRDNRVLDTIKVGLARQAYAVAQSGWRDRLPLLGRLLEEARLSTGSIPPQAQGTIADIGCGSGDRLELLQRAGWKYAVGVDPDPVAVATATRLGRKVSQGSAEQLPWADASLDAAILHHVIEHVRHPEVALREVLRVLKPHGRVALITPNIASGTQQRRGRHWRGLEAPRHLTIFTLQALAKTVRDCGFVVECARSSARSGAWNDAESQRVQQQGNAPRLGLLGRALRADALFRQQSAAIARGEQLGDELLVVARRPAEARHGAR